MHTQTALNDRRLAKFRLKIINAEMLNGSRKTTLKTKVIRHLVHDFREHADIGQQDLGRTYRRVENDRINEAIDIGKVVV